MVGGAGNDFIQDGIGADIIRGDFSPSGDHDLIEWSRTAFGITDVESQFNFLFGDVADISDASYDDYIEILSGDFKTIYGGDGNDTLSYEKFHSDDISHTNLLYMHLIYSYPLSEPSSQYSFENYVYGVENLVGPVFLSDSQGLSPTT